MQPLALYSYPSLTSWCITTVDYLDNEDVITRYQYLEDKKTGELYARESLKLIRAKCIGGVLAFPVYSTLYLTLHAARAVFTSLLEIKEVVSNVAEAASTLSMKKVSVQAVKGSTLFAWHLAGKVASFAAACFFLIGAEWGFAVGVFYPYKGRKIVAYAEKKLQKNVSYKCDIRRKNPLTALKEMDKTSFYFAYCFQPKCNKFDILSRLNTRSGTTALSQKK